MDCGREKEASVPEKKKNHNETSGGHFICGFGCSTYCTVTAPSARKGQKMSSQCGSHHGRDIFFTKSCTE